MATAVAAGAAEIVRLRLVTPPQPVVTLAEVKLDRGVDFPDHDELLTGLIAAATGWLDGSEGWLGRALGEQVWDMDLDAFPACRTDWIRVPLPPLIAIGSVSYIDPAGAAQVQPEDQRKLMPGGAWPSSLAPAYGLSWPATRCEPGAVTVRFTAGYAGDAIHPAIRAAILLMVGHLYEHREAVSVGGTITEVPLGVASLLAPLRVWGG